MARGWLIYWLLLVVAAVTACIYALACGAVSDGGFSIPNTWLYGEYNGNQTSTPTDDNIWLAGNFHDDGNMFIYMDVFRALPTQFSYWFAIGFLSSLDNFFRFTQPFVGMFDDAEPAETTLSLNYLTASSLQVPLDACDNGHWKVAWFASLATLAPLFPVAVTGLFTITETKTTVHFSIEKSAFWVVATYLAFFLISLPLAWPTYSRSTPRFALSLADLMGMCHQARFLGDPLFDIAGAKCSKDKMQAQLLLRENKYLFGWYLGRDGKPHVGFDMAETEVGGPTGLVKWIPPTKDSTQKCDSRPPLLDRLFKRKHSKRQQKSVEEGMEMVSILTRSETSPDTMPESPMLHPGNETVREV